MDVMILFFALLIILVGAEAFTNALEHIGERLGISEGVTGSIFAAVGTAMPETMVPIFAILAASGSVELRQDVGIGAILGAPLMLSTLAFFLLGLFGVKQRGWRGVFRPEPTGLARDLTWFNYAFALGVLAVLIPPDWRVARGFICLLLILLYVGYLYVTIQASAGLVEEGHATEADHPLYLQKIGLPNHGVVLALQLGLGLFCILLGAKGFVYGIEGLAGWLGISALALSLLIIPFATELPEKVNSLIWTSRGRDTLAFGNITGAMVFQGSLLPAFGIALTPWVPHREIIVGMATTLLASTYLSIVIRRGGSLKAVHLFVNGLCYVVFVVAVLWG